MDMDICVRITRRLDPTNLYTRMNQPRYTDIIQRERERDESQKKCNYVCKVGRVGQMLPPQAKGIGEEGRDGGEERNE